MKLSIVRNQKDKKGLLGGHKGVDFIATFKAEVSGEEQSLIDKYKMGDAWLHSWKIGIGTDHEYEFHVSVDNLIKGRTLEFSSIKEIIDAESEIIQSVKTLKNILELMRSFGGEEVIDI